MTYSKRKLLAGLRYQITHDDEKLQRALLLVYSFQTKDELTKNKSIYCNNVGFSKRDAQFLSGCSKYAQSHGELPSYRIPIIRNKMKKYAGQILASSIERGLIVQVSPYRYEILDRKPKV